jgi:hypothetical protein
MEGNRVGTGSKQSTLTKRPRQHILSQPQPTSPQQEKGQQEERLQDVGGLRPENTFGESSPFRKRAEKGKAKDMDEKEDKDKDRDRKKGYGRIPGGFDFDDEW